MRNPFATPALLTLALLAACVVPGEAPTAVEEPSEVADEIARAQALGYVPGQLLVRFREGAPMDELVRAEGGEIEREISRGTRIVGVPLGREQAIAAELGRHDLVEFAEPDYLYTVDVPCGTGDCAEPADGFFGYKWDLHNDGTITDSQGSDLASTGLAGSDVDWLEAFDAMTAVPGTAVIGIIDTGILDTHEDLAGKVVAGYDFYDLDPDPADDHGHGTHVAGIAAGRGDNGTGVPGVAWMDEVDVAVAKVCGYLLGIFHSCPSSAIADGITWSVDNGADVLNLSLGGPTGSAAVQSALQYARANDVLPFCAAGNDSGPVSFPAAFPECVAVSATNWSDGSASYSNFGSQVQISAPGGDFEDPSGYSMILSTYYTSNTTYAWLAGTSMASPQAAGLGGLLHALGVTDDDEKLTRMQSTADDLGAPGDDVVFGAGRINVYAAVADLIGGGPVNQPPIASFASSCADLACDFNDASTDPDGAVVAWEWDFGDGGSSNLQNPSHTYASGGTYSVTLSATDDGGATDSFSADVTVSGGPPNQAPTASFTSSCDGFTCDFTDTSTDVDGVIVAWNWGDGTSAEQNPSYTFPFAGTFPVSLEVTDDDGATDTYVDEVTVPATPANQPPTASFTSSCSELACDFTDTSTDTDGSVVQWDWDFGDGGSSAAQSPSYSYGSAGTYTVTLTVTDDDGATDSSSGDVTVTAPPPNQAPTASFTSSCSELACDFTDTSTDTDGSVVQWDWDFGDGGSSAAQSPSYSYGSAGTYTVTLTVTDDDGATDSSSGDVTVTAPPPNQAPTASFTWSCVGLTCDFTDASTDPDGTIVAWNWGDGFLFEQNPSYVFPFPGTFAISLEVTDDDGATDTIVQNVTVTAAEPSEPYVP